APTHRLFPTCSEKCCALTPTAPSQPIIRSITPGTIARSGHSVSAVPLPLAFNLAQDACSSTTWANRLGRKSTTELPAPTTAGLPPKAQPIIYLSLVRFIIMGTDLPIPPVAPSSAARSITHQIL